MSSDSSSSDDDDASRFREVCDPTLWMTAAQDGVTDNCIPSVAAESPPHLDKLCDDRQSFSLLEKLKASLSASRAKNGRVSAGSRSTGVTSATHTSKSGTGEAGGRITAAPSTLSPYLAKQLAITLDRNVGFSASQDAPPPVRPECGGSDGRQSFLLLKNQCLIHQDPQEDSHRRKRRVNIPKRLSYCPTSHEELVTRCKSVAVSPECILAGDTGTPPHPKNVRYVEEYKVMECRPDGSIIAIPLSDAPAAATLTTNTNKKKKEAKAKERVTQKVKDPTTNKKENKDVTQNGVTSNAEKPNANLKTRRKQERKRGKRKKKTAEI